MNQNPELPPRPVSHRWAIGIFGFTSFGFTVVLINAYNGRNGASLWAAPVMSAMFYFGFIAFVALLVGRRHTWAYYIASTCLAAWCIRGLQSAFYSLSAITSPSTSPYQFSTLITVPLLIYLFYRFTFGTPSRSYFGLRPVTTKPNDRNA